MIDFLQNLKVDFLVKVHENFKSELMSTRIIEKYVQFEIKIWRH